VQSWKQYNKWYFMAQTCRYSQSIYLWRHNANMKSCSIRRRLIRSVPTQINPVYSAFQSKRSQTVHRYNPGNVSVRSIDCFAGKTLHKIDLQDIHSQGYCWNVNKQIKSESLLIYRRERTFAEG
jgi:hypothetical protein